MANNFLICYYFNNKAFVCNLKIAIFHKEREKVQFKRELWKQVLTFLK